MPSSNSQVIVFDRDFHFLAELSCLTRRDWTLNSWGECRFDLGTNDPKFREEFIRYGRHLLVRHQYLPDWVGVIDTPRTWGRMRAEVSAVGAEKYFQWRHALTIDDNNFLSEIPLLEGTYGSVFRDIVALANRPEYTGISVGEVADGGPATQQKLTGYLSEALSEMATRSKQYWDVTPVFTVHSDVLGLRANWYYKKGSRIDNVALEEGRNIEFEDKPMTEEGELGTEVIAIGDTGVDAGAYSARRTSSNVGLYGLRQHIQRLTGVNEFTTVEAYAEQSIEHFSEPRRNFRLTVTDPTLYPLMITGNEFTVALKTVGFHDGGKPGWSGQIMITGVHYTDYNNIINIDVKSLNEVSWTLYG